MISNKIIVRFSANHLPLSWAIRVKTWSKYSHADFLLKNGKYLGALPFKGVCLHDHKYPTEDFFELDISKEESDIVIKNAINQIGKPYDFKGIFGFATCRDWQEEDSWFCSEFIAGCIQPVHPIFNEQAFRISPRDLAINTLFKKIDIK